MYISSFSISGYRSLLGVKIKNMLPVCIFHGLNNTGKSNILSALEVIFCRKLVVEETTATEVTKHERLGSFWQGKITDFRDNFFMNGRKDIEFSVSITFAHDELKFLMAALEGLQAYFVKPQYNKVLNLNGRMRYLDDESADMLLEEAFFNNKENVVFAVDKAGKKTFFPKVTTLSPEEKFSSFENLMNLLADSFAVLPADRYLTVERELDDPKETLVLTPKTFKKWLFNLSLTRVDHHAFEEIRAMFSSPPFSCGEIGFSKERGEIEIMVNDESARLPISRLGSGHQQILYIIASLVLHRGKMLGIEELEINLSPTAQKDIFEKLKEYIRGGTGLLSQLIITSHSDYFEFRQDVRCYGVTHVGNYTSVSPWSRAARRKYFGV